MKANTNYSMERGRGYGNYHIVKTTPTGKITKAHTTDSVLWDDYTDGDVSQLRLKRAFDTKINSFKW